MEKEAFLKEVAALFATSKFHELHNFLTENKEDTITHKKIIKSLNKELGSELILTTLAVFEKEEKAIKKAFSKSIDDALRNNNGSVFFDLIKPLNIDHQFDLIYRIYNRDEIYKKLIKNLIDNREQLSEGNQKSLRNLCVECANVSLLEELGVYYCNNTNNVLDKISVLKQKANIYVHDKKVSDEDRVEVVNQLFDLLEANKSNENLSPELHFSKQFEQFAYLSEYNLKKLNTNSSDFNQSHIIDALTWNKKALNYYLQKQNHDFKIELHLETYLKIKGQELDTSKIVIKNNSELTASQLATRLIYNPSLVSIFSSDSKIKDFIKEKNNSFDFPNEPEILNQLLNHMNKEEVDNFFNQSPIFKLNNTQKATIANYLNNYEENIIKSINNKDKDEQLKFIGGRAIQAYVKDHINDDVFIEKLNGDGKKNILNSYINYSKIEDSTKFINNFLIDLPKTEFSCFHESIAFQLEGMKYQEEIMSYILNEKTAFNSHSLYHCLEVFHFLNDDKKNELVGTILNEKSDKNHFLSYCKNIEKHDHLDSKQKTNLKNIKKIYNTLVAEKENKISQSTKYQVKKK